MVLLIAQQARHAACLVKGALGIENGVERAAIDLLVVRVPGLQFGGRDVKGDGTRTQAERIEMSVRVIEPGLKGLGSDRQRFEFQHRGAVDFLDAAILVLAVHFRHKRIAHHPVVVSTLAGTRSPFVESPMT